MFQHENCLGGPVVELKLSLKNVRYVLGSISGLAMPNTWK